MLTVPQVRRLGVSHNINDSQAASIGTRQSSTLGQTRGVAAVSFLQRIVEDGFSEIYGPRLPGAQEYDTDSDATVCSPSDRLLAEIPSYGIPELNVVFKGGIPLVVAGVPYFTSSIPTVIAGKAVVAGRFPATLRDEGAVDVRRIFSFRKGESGFFRVEVPVIDSRNRNSQHYRFHDAVINQTNLLPQFGTKAFCLFHALHVEHRNIAELSSLSCCWIFRKVKIMLSN